MTKNEKDVLKAIYRLTSNSNPEKKVSITYSYKVFSRNSNLTSQEFETIINLLQNDGWIEVEKQGRNTKLISITGAGVQYTKDILGIASKRKSQKLEKWALIFTIIGGIISLIFLAPTLFQFWRDVTNELIPKNDYLVIQKAELLPQTNRIALQQEIDPSKIDPEDDYLSDVSLKCNNSKDLECKPLIYINSITKTPQIKLDITSRQTELPLSITGLELTLLNFSTLPGSPFKYLIHFGCGGGGGGYFPYAIYSYPDIETPLPFARIETTTYKNPVDWIGKNVKATPLCKEGADCEKFLYVNNDQVEGLELDLPFIETIPPGWYEFAVNINYSYENKDYISKTNYVFDVIKPNVSAPWWKGCKSKPYPSFINLDVVNQQVLPNIQISPMPNPPGKLIITSIAGDENGVYIVDMQEGGVQHVGEYNSVLPKMISGKTEINKDGLLWVYETPVDTELPNWRSDIVILDLEQEKTSLVPSKYPNRNLEPSLSPSGDFIAYVTFINQTETPDLKLGDADVFIYDLETKTSKRITFTPNIIETHPVWVGEDKIAYLIPKIDNVSYEYAVGQDSIGVEVLNLLSGEKQEFIFNADVHTELEFLDKKNALLVSTIFPDKSFKLLNLSDGNIHTINPPPENISSQESGCHLLNSEKNVFLCLDNTNQNASIYLENNGSFTKVFNAKEDNPSSILVGRVFPDNIGIANLNERTITEFTQDGERVQNWVVPDLSTLLHFYNTFYDLPEFIIVPDIEKSTHDNNLGTNEPQANDYIYEKTIDASIKEKKISIVVHVPYLAQGSDPVSLFNNSVEKFVSEEIEEGTKIINEQGESVEGGLSVFYSITSSNVWSIMENPAIIRENPPIISLDEAKTFSGHNILSILFENFGYFGGAHPSSHHHTINYDLSTDRILQLENLFRKDSPYLSDIADYCIKELQKKDEYLFDDFQKNASATNENYRVWNITRDGLLIIFEEYQVAPYASGPQYVLVPFSEIKENLDPEGPLGKYTK